ncbi:MAG: hypothetical protein ACPG77_12030, partial [Nannocystaceae bacterium]
MNTLPVTMTFSPFRMLAVCVVLTPSACGGGGEDRESDSQTTATSPTATTLSGTLGETNDPTNETASGTEDSTTEGPTTSETEPTTSDPTSETTDSGSQTDPTDPTDPTDVTTDSGCGACDEPNQTCVDNECILSCQGQDPDPCGPDEVCDVISGACKLPEDSCTLAGPYEACDGQQCGPGTVCDGQGSCLAVAPCAVSECTSEGVCWGAFCSCTRNDNCDVPPDLEALNGPFSTEIVDLEFVDDCTAWMATLRSGTDFVRRLETDGTVTEWAGVS